MRAWPLLLVAAEALVLACGSSTSSPPPSPQSESPADDGGAEPEASIAADDATMAAVARDGQVGGGEPDTGIADAGPARPSEAGPAPARPSTGCSGNPTALATGNVDITFGGAARSYLLHVSTAAASAPRPLVVSLHPYTASGAAQESLTGMSALADKEGFVVVYPNGLGNPTNWNAGACCSSGAEGDRDDKGFLGAVVDDIGAHLCIDLARVYVEGFSNGGMMTVRLACEMADRFAAAATVSGTATVPLAGCKPSRPIAFMHVHGTSDTLVPYDGGNGGLPLSGRPTPVFPAVSQEVATLRSDDACPASSTASFDQGSAHCDHWGPCGGDSEVVLCTIQGGSHAWPASSGTGGVFTESSPFDATTQIWQFLQRHALR
jgi:polyhydroxybutyrate depolymerase